MFALACTLKSEFLMPVEPELFAEEARGVGKDRPAVRERREICAALEGRIELKDGLGPQEALSEFITDEFVDLLVEDIDETLQVVFVLISTT